MGPNLYITPPGGRTWFHEDGHGTVDSGHQCLTGHNEVIMLRRVTDEPTRLNALSRLNHGEALDNTRPHDDATLSTAEKPWPSQDTLDFLRDDLHTCPASIVLGPGEYIHINKGRLHAFRKKKPPPGQRESAKDVCISVAWDWMFQGFTPAGRHGEVDVGSFNGTCTSALRKYVDLPGSVPCSLLQYCRLVHSIPVHSCFSHVYVIALCRHCCSFSEPSFSATITRHLQQHIGAQLVCTAWIPASGGGYRETGSPLAPSRVQQSSCEKRM